MGKEQIYRVRLNSGNSSKKFVKSDKSLGSKKQKTVRGIFSNAARVVTYVKRII